MGICDRKNKEFYLETASKMTDSIIKQALSRFDFQLVFCQSIYFHAICFFLFLFFFNTQYNYSSRRYGTETPEEIDLWVAWIQKAIKIQRNLKSHVSLEAFENITEQEESLVT